MQGTLKLIVSCYSYILMHSWLHIIITFLSLQALWLGWTNSSGMDCPCSFKAAKKIPVYPDTDHTKKHTGGFYQAYKNLAFYWILNAGHMVRVCEGWGWGWDVRGLCVCVCVDILFLYCNSITVYKHHSINYVEVCIYRYQLTTETLPSPCCGGSSLADHKQCIDCI